MWLWFIIAVVAAVVLMFLSILYEGSSFHQNDRHMQDEPRD